MDCRTPHSCVLHCLLEFAQVHVSDELSQWCHPTISSSVVLFSSCPQSFPASGSLPVSQFFTSGGQSIGASASISVLPVTIQGWFPLGLTGLISSLSKGLSSLLQHHSSKASILWCSAFSCRNGSVRCMLASSIGRRWKFLAPGPLSHSVQWTVEVSHAHCSGTRWRNSYGSLPTRGGGLQALLPTEPLEKAKACPRGSVPAITSSSGQRDVALWRGPNLLFQDVCQSSLECETILWMMIIHFDYTSALGKYGTFFFCNVWEQSSFGYWSLPIRKQCCDIITFAKQMDHHWARGWSCCGERQQIWGLEERWEWGWRAPLYSQIRAI